jgi:hypothetical protein
MSSTIPASGARGSHHILIALADTPTSESCAGGHRHAHQFVDRTRLRSSASRIRRPASQDM